MHVVKDKILLFIYINIVNNRMHKVAMTIPRSKSKEELEKELKEEMNLRFEEINYIYEDELYSYSFIRFNTRNELENFCTMYPFELSSNNIINVFYVNPKDIYLK